MARTSSRKSQRRDGQQKGEGRTGRRRSPRREGAQQVRGERGPMASIIQAGEEGRRMMEKTADEQLRMGQQGLKQAQELTSRTAPWWGPVWGMWDAWDIARSWTEMNLRIWDTATRAMRGESMKR